MPSATTPLVSAGKAAEGEPRVRRPAARRQLEPLAEGRIRAPTALRPCGAHRACSGPGPLGPRRARERARRGQDDDDLRRLRAALRGRLERPPGARRGQRTGRVLLRRRADLVRAVHLADRTLPGRCIERLGLQGKRRLASGGGRQGHAERRRSGALVLGDVRAHGWAEDPAPATPPERLLSRALGGRRAQDVRRGGRRPRRRPPSRPDAGRLGVPRSASRARAGDARRRRTLERRALNVRVGLVWLRVALGHARPRRRRDPHRHGAGGDLRARSGRSRARRRDELRRTLRAVDRRRRRQPRRPARLVLVRERAGRRHQRGRVPPAWRRRRVVGLSIVGDADAGAGRRRRVPRAVPARPRREGAACRGRRAVARSRKARPDSRRPGRTARAARRQRPDDRPGSRLPRGAKRRPRRLHRGHGRRASARAEPRSCPLPLRGPPVSPGPAAALLAAAAAAALLADRLVSVAAIAVMLLAVSLRGSEGRRGVYLWGTFVAGFWVAVLTPLLAAEGSHYLWEGPTVPVLGPLGVTAEELVSALLSALRLVAVGLAFAAYALLLDHDRLVQAAGFARRSALSVALATRLVPTLERDGRGLLEALRGRGVEVRGIGGHARLLSPLLAGSLERGLNLAEAMEARGYGRPGGTRAPTLRAPLDRPALVAAAALVVAGALWL